VVTENAGINSFVNGLRRWHLRRIATVPVFGFFLDLLFPPLCHSCRAFIPNAGRIHICTDCLATSRSLDSPFCTVCGVPFRTEGGLDHLCGDCLSKPPAFAAARAAVVYEGAVRELIHRFKYSGRVQARRPLGLLLAERLAGFVHDVAPDLILPVPLHPKRLRRRGFNQAVLLGELVSREWGVPMARRVIRRVRWTEPQITLAAGDRAANVRGAFAVADPDIVRGKRILLIDDVMTTGSTLSECARMLGKAGAAAVFAAVVARVPD
jgi:ComF family protein